MSETLIEFVDGAGKTQIASTATPLPTTGGGGGGTATFAGNVYAPGSLPTLAGNGQPISIDAGGAIYTHDRALTSADVVSAHTNATRAAGVTHRSAITASDRLAIPTLGSASLQTGGSITVAAGYYVSASAYNKYGPTGAATPVGNITTTSGNQTIRLPITQVAGATGYDIFCSASSTAPLWVGRITEAQRASGILITGVGTTGAGGTAGAVDIQVIGTGNAANVAPFTANNAYTPESLTAINCAGYSLAHIKVALSVTDLRTQPTLVLVPFLVNSVDGFYDQAQVITVSLAGASGPAMRQDYVLQVDGSTGLVVCLGTLTGQGLSVTVVVELS